LVFKIPSIIALNTDVGIDQGQCAMVLVRIRHLLAFPPENNLPIFLHQPMMQKLERAMSNLIIFGTGYGNSNVKQ
jgi:hypothetical protein